MKFGMNKKNFVLIVLLLVFSACVTSMTYAYFALTDISNNVVYGNVGDYDEGDNGTILSLTTNQVKPVASSGSTHMVPQKESALSQAISSTYNCVDANNNTICRVYEIKVENVGNYNVKVNGIVNFGTDVSTMPNLKWQLITNSNTLGSNESYFATNEDQIFASDVVINKGTSVTYYMLIWINETGAAQTDSGSITPNIRFESAIGEGGTSTIRNVRVNYDSNGGNGNYYTTPTEFTTLSSKSIAPGNTYGELPIPGHSSSTMGFDGWYTSYTHSATTLNASDDNNSYMTVLSSVYPSVTYNLSFTSATLTTGTATQFTVAIYDETNASILTSVLGTFGSNTSVSITTSKSLNSEHAIKLVVFAGVRGSTGGNVASFSDCVVTSGGLPADTLITEDSTMAVDVNHVLFARWSTRKVYVSYNVMGGTIKANTTASDGTKYSWSTDDYGWIHLNSGNYPWGKTVNYGTSSCGSSCVMNFANYDNSSFISVTKSNTSIWTENEWVCIGGDCAIGKTYNDAIDYYTADTANYMCTNTIGNEHCYVKVGVNWYNYADSSYFKDKGGNSNAYKLRTVVRSMYLDVDNNYWSVYDPDSALTAVTSITLRTEDGGTVTIDTPELKNYSVTNNQHRIHSPNGWSFSGYNFWGTMIINGVTIVNDVKTSSKIGLGGSYGNGTVVSIKTMISHDVSTGTATVVQSGSVRHIDTASYLPVSPISIGNSTFTLNKIIMK